MVSRPNGAPPAVRLAPGLGHGFSGVVRSAGVAVMSTKSQVPTREQLYEEVWQTPIRKLATKYGLSDVGLAKLLKRLNVPRPPVGYWAKRSAGKAPAKPTLPPYDVPELADAAERRKPSRGTAKLSMHPLIANAYRQVERGWRDHDGLVRIDARKAAAIRVMPKSAGRALRLFAALIKAWESAGHCVGPNAGSPDGGTQFVVGSDTVPVSLVELSHRVARERRSSWNHARGKTAPGLASGELAFVLSFVEEDRDQPPWRDLADKRLESMIDTIATELVAQARRCTEVCREREIEYRQYQKVHARREARRKLDREEQSWEKFVMDAVRDWHAAEQIRAYLAAYRRAVDCGHRFINDEAAYDNYLAWVNYFAVKADPLITTGLRPGEAVTPTNLTVAEMDLSSRLRSALEALGVQDGNGVYHVTDGQLQKHTGSWTGLRKEIERVLFGLGFDVKDEQASPR